MGVEGNSNHQKQVAAMTKIAVNLYEQTYAVPALRGTTPLRFELLDSRFRYLIFCLSIVHSVCAPRMKNPDAVLNACAQALISNALDVEDADGIFDRPVSDRQRVANDGMGYLEDFLHRWSAYIDVARARNRQAATGLVASMLRTTESDAPSDSTDGPRLWPLALAFEDRFKDIAGAFNSLSGETRASRPVADGQVSRLVDNEAASTQVDRTQAQPMEPPAPSAWNDGDRRAFAAGTIALLTLMAIGIITNVRRPDPVETFVSSTSSSTPQETDKPSTSDFQPALPVQSIMVGDQAIVLAAPTPFVEVSSLFPEGFGLRQETIPEGNRLLAWLIPSSVVQDRLNGVARDHRALQVQVLAAMTQARYDATVISSLARDIREFSLPLAQESINEVLRQPKFEEIDLQLGIERSLGLLEQGPDFVTLGMVMFAKRASSDKQVISRLVLRCSFLVRGKIVLLSVTGLEATPDELRTAVDILGEWRAAMRVANRY